MERMNKFDLLTFIQKTNFTMMDLNLYLDTHPDCPHALSSFREHQKMLAAAMNIYQKKYGPLTTYSMQTGENWNWTDEPWPWQKGCDC